MCTSACVRGTRERTPKGLAAPGSAFTRQTFSPLSPTTVSKFSARKSRERTRIILIRRQVRASKLFKNVTRPRVLPLPLPPFGEKNARKVANPWEEERKRKEKERRKTEESEGKTTRFIEIPRRHTIDNIDEREGIGVSEVLRIAAMSGVRCYWKGG